ncbi:AdoMet-dependent rRNA methyltransferase spb1 [Lambiella insularis]|nr:AdoMet-dependent rRNA methyltransferase spb1 [Lambiella insularis]
MGIQKKHGKGRLDKWYKLAKEKGYRARAAFKLIQLNRKYGFLEKSKVLLDLCAAPGSWCQVAAETMPANSLIIGVDLAPIKPIPKTITFQSDITTDKCRATIRSHLKTWKADTVLHDGAPNVGTAWVQDAFSQAELVLQSMKLATEFLMEGGTFVTKVFRSKDYNALLWVLKQLFDKVEATKPPSSRNVSAEIFVVCRGFKAPKRIDPKFLDPRSVFAELAGPTSNNEAKVFNPEKKKRKRDGYEEGDYIQFREVPANDFIQSADPVAMLGSLNKLSFEHMQNGDIALTTLESLSETTPEVKECCSDLKVLGRKEFRILLRWRLKVRQILGFSAKKEEMLTVHSEEVVRVAPLDEELRIQEELQSLHDKESSRRKRERRRENERKQRETVRMQMHMLPPKEIGLEQSGPNGEDSMFALSIVDKSGTVGRLVRGRMMIIPHSDEPVNHKPSAGSDESSDEEEDLLDRELDVLYEQYQDKKSELDAKFRARKARRDHSDGGWEGLSEDEHSVSEDIENERKDDGTELSSEDDGKGPLVRPLVLSPDQIEEETSGLTKGASLFFDQEIFQSIGDFAADSSGNSVLYMKADSRNAGRPANGSGNDDIDAPARKLVSRASHPRADTQAQDKRELTGTNAQSQSGSGLVTAKVLSDWEMQAETRQDGRLDIEIITAEAMTLAQQIASGLKSTHDFVDEGFNKYAFQDRYGLPDWFLDDEHKHSKPHRPISAAGAAAIKEKLRVLNARPIKKIREAKDRKKFRAAQRLEKLRKKSALLADEEGMTEKDKAQNISKLMGKAAKKKPKQQIKVVVARGGNRGISGRPRGVKGKYKIVDARLKKDVRAEKRLSKKQH